MAISKLRSKSFLKGLKGKNPEDDQKIVKEHISNIKRVAKSGDNEELDMHIKELEHYVKRLLNVQKNMMSKESNDFIKLKEQMKDLRARLKLTSLTTPKQLDKIEFLLGEMSSQLSTYNKVQNRREQKMLELERKVNESIAKNYSEILIVEKQIKGLENKYDKLKESSDIDSKTLKRLENKINDLKARLIDKKAEIVERKQQEMMQQHLNHDKQTHLDEISTPYSSSFQKPKEEKLLEAEHHALLEDMHEENPFKQPPHSLDDIPEPHPLDNETKEDIDMDDFDTDFLEEEKEGFFKRIINKIKSWFSR